MPTILDTSRDNVDWGQPTNWDNDLNAGLVMWRLAVPNRLGWGSGIWRDMVRPAAREGTLTNMDPATDWVPGGRPGVWGAVSFDGTDDYVSCGVGGLPAIDGAKTIEIVLKHHQTATRHILFSLVLNDTGSASNALSIESTTEASTANLTVAEWGGTRRCIAFVGSGDANVGTDYFHFIYTSDSAWANQKMYVNGVDWTGTGAFAPSTSTQTGATGVCRIGSFNTAFPDPYWNTPVSSVRVSGRSVTASEAAMRYEQWRQSYPGLLNRITPWYYGPAAAGGTSILRQMIQQGLYASSGAAL